MRVRARALSSKTFEGQSRNESAHTWRLVKLDAIGFQYAGTGSSLWLPLFMFWLVCFGLVAQGVLDDGVARLYT
jgi:hypothetical protein